jgi:hypothetical protein
MRVAKPDIQAKLLEGTVDYILNLTGLKLRPLAPALGTSPCMRLYFSGSKERLLAEALCRARKRQQEEWTRPLSARRKRRNSLALAGRYGRRRRTWFMWLFFEAYVLAMRNRKRFPGFLERMVKDGLSPFEQAVAAVGFEAESVWPLATFIHG